VDLLAARITNRVLLRLPEREPNAWCGVGLKRESEESEAFKLREQVAR